MNGWLTGRAPIDKTKEEEGDEDDEKRKGGKEATPACFLLRINGQATECNEKNSATWRECNTRGTKKTNKKLCCSTYQTS